MNKIALKPVSQAIHTRIVSQTPGRMRLKVAPAHRNYHVLQKIANQLKAQPDVCEVQVNHNTGSILIHHQHDQEAIHNLVATLRDLGVIFGSLTHGESDAAAGVANAFADLNQRIGEATDGFIDLRFIVPVGLGALAVRQLLVKGLQLEIVPWYVLAWYSFDSFIKLHYTSKPQAKTKEMTRFDG